LIPLADASFGAPWLDLIDSRSDKKLDTFVGAIGFRQRLNGAKLYPRRLTCRNVLDDDIDCSLIKAFDPNCGALTLAIRDPDSLIHPMSCYASNMVPLITIDPYTAPWR
jgi:hypothetical protein